MIILGLVAGGSRSGIRKAGSESSQTAQFRRLHRQGFDGEAGALQSQWTIQEELLIASIDFKYNG